MPVFHGAGRGPGRSDEGGSDDGSRDHLVILGLMGVGKTTVGAAVAARLGRPLHDSDAAIERLLGITGRALAARDGVGQLHRVEEAVLLGALATEQPAVITAAGWTVESAVCRAAIRHRARTVLLRLPLDEIHRRQAAGNHRRPMPIAELAGLAARREPLFAELAEVSVDAAMPPGVLVDEILAGLA